MMVKAIKIVVLHMLKAVVGGGGVAETLQVRDVITPITRGMERNKKPTADDMSLGQVMVMIASFKSTGCRGKRKVA
jgi:hypothetical protein